MKHIPITIAKAIKADIQPLTFGFLLTLSNKPGSPPIINPTNKRN